MSTLVAFCAFADRAAPPMSSDAKMRRTARFRRFTMTPVRILSDDFRPSSLDFGSDLAVFNVHRALLRIGGGPPAGRPVSGSGEGLCSERPRTKVAKDQGRRSKSDR